MRTVIGILTCLGMLAGCEQPKKEAAQAQAQMPVTKQAPHFAERPAVELHGKLLEKIDASSYTYLKLATPSGEAWAAIPATDVEPGTEVTVLDARQMGRFESKTLHRTFDDIAFGSGLQGIAPREKAPTYQAAPATLHAAAT